MKQKRGHSWFKYKKIPWLTFCRRCGLVFLKNAATEKAIKNGCPD
jgi:hypothetical protein